MAYRVDGLDMTHLFIHYILEHWVLVFCLFVCFVFLFFRDRVSLYSPGCPGAHFVDQAVLKLRNPPVFASQVLELKACTTTARLNFIF